MLHRPLPDAVTPTGVADRPRRHWTFAFMACAGLMGAAGVGVGRRAPMAEGDLARISSDFLLIHAAAVTAISAAALAMAGTSALLVTALGLMVVGAVLFGGELAFASLADWRPVPLAAPTGGLCLIAGWLVLAVTAAVGMHRR